MTNQLCEICGAPAVSEFSSERLGPSCLTHASHSYQLGALMHMTDLLCRLLAVYAPQLPDVARAQALLDQIQPDYRRRAD